MFSYRKFLNYLDIKVLFLFLCIYYASVGFYFGIGNNVEELPIIFQRAGIYDYANDPFVLATTERFNVTTIYTFGLSQIAKITGPNGLKYAFFFLHLICLSTLFLAFSALLRVIINSSVSKYFILVTIVTLLFGDRLLQWMPNTRTLFPNILDPEFVVLPFLFWAIYHFITENHRLAALILLFAALVHPLYTLPLAGSFIASYCFFLINKPFYLKSLAPLFFYCLSVIPFSLLLWYFSHQTLTSEYNPSLIHEIIRAPHHLVIPSLRSSDRLSYIRFFELTLFFSSMGFILFYFKNIWSPSSLQSKDTVLKRSHAISRLYVILACLVIYLLASSAITSFIRIDLLVALTPYRIGIIVIAISFILFSAAISEFIKDNNVNKKYTYLPIIGIFFFALIGLYKHERIEPLERGLAIDWIKQYTADNSLWLNYADIDIRTHCGRSDFFQFKTIPVYEDAQIDWYKRLCLYYDAPKAIWLDYQSVRKHIKSECTTINVERVLNQLKHENLDYLLIDNEQKISLQKLPASLVYQNNQYTVYDLNKHR